MSKYDIFNPEEDDPGYLIFDNLEETISAKLSMLQGCRREAEALTDAVCGKEPELGQRKFVNQTARCDALIWLTDLMTEKED